MLLTWCDGEDVEAVLPRLSETDQYALGVKAGGLLREIHTLPASPDAEPWGVWFRRRLQGQVDFFKSHPIQSANGEKIIRHLLDNQNLLDERPQMFHHGDAKMSNLIVMPDGKVGIIDFNAFNRTCGDPWWESVSIAWGTEPPAYFFTGYINGYFDGRPPTEFFQLLRYYIACDALAALCETAAGGQEGSEKGRRHLKNVLRWFNNLQSPVPTWYLKDFTAQ